MPRRDRQKYLPLRYAFSYFHHTSRTQRIPTSTHTQLCQQLRATGNLLEANAFLSVVKKNDTDTRSLTLCGTIFTVVTCKGFRYCDPYGTWYNAVVQASVKITVRDYYAATKQRNNQLSLKSGITCILNEEHCIDADGNESYWSAIPSDSCGFSEYNDLHERPAVKLTSAVLTEGPTLSMVTSRDVIFAFTRTSDFALCRYTLVLIKHPNYL